MSAPEVPATEDDDEAGPLLSAAYDDPQDPSEVTVFPLAVEDPTTCWITADVDSVVSLEAAI
jgi:hypothetical protein